MQLVHLRAGQGRHCQHLPPLPESHDAIDALSVAEIRREMNAAGMGRSGRGRR
jgi:hypothetical protein